MGNNVSITKTILTAWSNYDNSIKTCQYVSGDEFEIKPCCFYFQITGKNLKNNSEISIKRYKFRKNSGK